MSNSSKNIYKWVVLNQAQSPAFQKMLELLANDLGACLVYTGMPHPLTGEQFRLEVQVGPPYDRRNLLWRAFSWVRFAIAAAIRVLRLPGRPFLFVVNNPPILALIVLILHKLRGYSFTMVVWDIYPDHLIRAGILSSTGVIARSWVALNRSAMRHAKVIITLSNSMADVLRVQLGQVKTQVRIEVIPNWADTEWLKPIEKAQNPFAIKHGQVGKITVLYSGNMGSGFRMEALVEVARAFRGNPHIAFMLIGDGLGRDELNKAVSAYALKNVMLLPFQPWNILPYTLATGDIALVMQPPGSEHLSLPSKIYSSIAVGSAIIACTNEESDLAYIVRKHGIGIVCPSKDAEAIISGIKLFLDDKQRLENCKLHARQVAEKYYSTHAILNRFRNILIDSMKSSFSSPWENESPKNNKRANDE